MDTFLHRYRNVTTLLVAILLQLVLLGYQVRNDQDVPLVRVWSVSAVSPLASALDSVRGGIGGFFKDYVVLVDTQEENTKLRAKLDEALLENQQLRSQLQVAEVAESLRLFRESSTLETLPAQVIGNTTGNGEHVVLVDQGSRDGVRKGMAAIVPEGIVGKVVNVFPNASYVLLATDPSFAAGVISQNHRVVGTAKGLGETNLRVDYVPNEKVVEDGERWYTSGTDRIFPRGLPVGVATEVAIGASQKKIQLIPGGFARGLEALLIVTSGAHGEIPDPETNVSDAVPSPDDAAQEQDQVGSLAAPAQGGPMATDADRITERVRAIGEAQGHVFGERGNGAPNFNLSPTSTAAPSPASAPNSASQ